MLIMNFSAILKFSVLTTILYRGAPIYVIVLLAPGLLPSALASLFLIISVPFGFLVSPPPSRFYFYKGTGIILLASPIADFIS
jgi:hypothetical protein